MKNNPVFWLVIIILALMIVPGIIFYACGNHFVGSVCFAGAAFLAVISIVMAIVGKRRNG